MRNPLIQSKQPHALPDFPGIDPRHVIPAIDSLLADYRLGMEKWLENGDDPDWSIVESEVAWADGLHRAWSAVSHLNSVADNEELRKAYNEGLEKLTEHETWRQQNRGIYGIYRKLKDSPDFGRLTPVQQRIIDL